MFIDNFDSFSHILADYIRQCGVQLKIARNDVPLAELRRFTYKGLILSPGPGIPSRAGYLMEILEYYHDKLPVLGICQGHQAIGEFFGARLNKSVRPMHGKVSEVIRTEGHPILEGLPDRFNVTRYHSLELKELSPVLEIILTTEKGEVMAISHKSLSIVGLQFHPEAYLTEYGLEIIRNWIRESRIKKKAETVRKLIMPLGE